MADDFEEKFIKPIINASYPGTLAGLALAVLSIGGIVGVLKIVLVTSALMFILSAFFVFFYGIYPARKKLWTVAAITFLSGLSCSITAALLLFVLPT
jgi:hypothetical protein